MIRAIASGPLLRVIRDTRAVAFIEFALIFPLFVGFVLAGIEFTYYVMANNRVQRMAAMTADLVSQSGIGAIGATEGQIYDLFSAVDLTAKPFDLRTRGRIVITSIRGTDNNNDKIVEKRILWQRFDGSYVTAAPIVGCGRTSDIAIMPTTRVVTLDEILFHVQVTYAYQPLISRAPFGWLNLPTSFTRTAVYRGRSNQFISPTPDTRFPPKSNCTTANGL